jgi:hypothetical protein
MKPENASVTEKLPMRTPQLEDATPHLIIPKAPATQAEVKRSRSTCLKGVMLNLSSRAISLLKQPITN